MSPIDAIGQQRMSNITPDPRDTEFTEDLFKLLFLGDFLCALCASAVQTPIAASHRSLNIQAAVR